MRAFFSVALIWLLGSFALTQAQEVTYQEGVHYVVLPTPAPTQDPDKIEIAELFWYGCPHCYHFEPHLKGWLKRKPSKVNFIRIPAIFNSPEWQLHATAFYTAEALGKGEQIHTPMFDAIHQKNRPLRNRQQLMEFFAEQGVSSEDFNNTFDSFAVQAKVQRAADLTRKYEVSGVPTVIVNGKYRTDGPMATSYENLVKIIDHLVRQELKAAKAATK